MEVILTDTAAKFQAIKQRLPSYTVRCTFGGLEEFPRNEVAVDIDRQFKPKFKIPRAKRQLVAELKRLCQKATTIYIATDIGIIGEYVGWRIARALKLDSNRTKRLSFASLTESGLKSALQNKSAHGFDHKRIEAFQARLVCDRLVRFQISPLLSKFTGTDVVVGRRHASIFGCVSRARETPPYGTRFDLNIRFEGGLSSTFQKTFETKDQAASFVERMSRSRFEIAKDNGHSGAKLMPFTTHSLIRHTNRTILADVSTVLEAAWRLYHFGKITFVLTDSTLVERDPAEKVHRGIDSNIERLDDVDGFAQAIHVTDPSLPWLEGNIPLLDKTLYHEIWKRTVYSQLDDCVTRTVTLTSRETGDITCEISMSRTLDQENIFSNRSLTNEMIQLRSITALETPYGTISTFDLACFNFHNGFKGTTYPFDNLNLHGCKDVLWTAAPKWKIECKTNSPVTCDSQSNNIVLTPLGEKVLTFLRTHFPRLTSSDFIATVESKFEDIETGKDDWTEVADFVQKSIYPAINRLRKGKAILEPRAVRHPRALGYHPSTGEHIKVVKAKYGPCLMMGRGEKCTYFKITKSQYDTLDLDTAIPLLDRRRLLDSQSHL